MASPEAKPRGTRRLLGFDRSGPAPAQTRPGEPLRPWTIPNFVGYTRLAALPVFLYLALNSGDGHSVAAAAIFWLVAIGDYLDGFLARATGQYSRMGAMLDPVVDRATILSGAVVCWHFELLPRWALAVLAVREVVTLVLAEIARRRGHELRVNWLGRVAVWPIMTAIFLSLLVESVVWDALLIGGVACAVLATLSYVRTGLRAEAEPV